MARAQPEAHRAAMTGAFEDHAISPRLRARAGSALAASDGKAAARREHPCEAIGADHVDMSAQALPPQPRPRRRPRAPVPPGACDAHAHVFAPAGAFAYAERRPYTPAPDTGLAAYRRMLDVIGFARGVLVHSNIYGPDNRATLDALRQLAGGAARDRAGAAGGRRPDPRRAGRGRHAGRPDQPRVPRRARPRRRRTDRAAPRRRSAGTCSC